jgi:hypothetical protein
MKATFQMLLVLVLTLAIVLCTCGLVYFGFLLFQRGGIREYLWPWFGGPLIVELWALTLLIWPLRRTGAAMAAVTCGALLNLIVYARHNRFESLRINIALDFLIIVTVGTIWLARREASAVVESKGATESSNRGNIVGPRSFWSSLDQASKVSIITSLVAAGAGIVGAIIGILPRPR